MCLGGGGGGGGDGGSAERKAAEDARQSGAIQNLNRAFGVGGAGREELYGKIAADSKALQLDDLGRERGIAERDVNFDLARRGLFGGSRQIDSESEIGDQFNRGVLTADNNAQSVANDARMGDERTRVSLINSIRSGMDGADASSAAFNAMSANANQAEINAKNQNIGGFFDAIRGSANQFQQADAQQKAFEKYRTGGATDSGYRGSIQTVR